MRDLSKLEASLSDGALVVDPDAIEPRLLVQFPQEPLLERLARVDAAGRNLRAGLRLAAVLEDEQLGTAVALARHVGEHALAHYFSALSFALYARLAAW